MKEPEQQSAAQGRHVWPESLLDGSEMGRRIYEHDWSQTLLGPLEQWSQSLRSMVGMMVANSFPLVIWWTKDLVQIYNDPYIPVIAGKHPEGLGQTMTECWPELWPVVKDIFEGVFRTGKAVQIEDQMLPATRHGYVEELYITIAYSPLRDDDGEIGGVITTVGETTEQVLGRRRLRTLRDLGARTPEAKNLEEACRIAIDTLAENAHDLPFALLYLSDETGTEAQLVGAAGLEPDTAASPTTISLTTTDDTDDGAWPLAQALLSKSVEVDDLGVRFGELPGGPWPESTHTALMLPITSPTGERPTGFLVAGISPRRVLDDEYGEFLMLVADQVSTAVATARAYEEERKRAEALAELDKAKTEFFSNVSHEFRTPLTLMLGPLEEMLEGEDEVVTAPRETLEVTHRNGLRLLKLVNSLLDFSRIEAGRAQAVYEPTDLSTYTAELASAFQSAIESAGLRYEVDCPSLEEPIYVDREMWEKIVLNLISNALKFTFKGGIKVSLKPVDDHVELTVRDTGTGIAEEEIPRLFERFHRVEGARSRTHEGSGIGLALVQELVKLQGGSIEVESTPGEGSIFTVSIPNGTTHLPADRIGSSRQLASTATDTNAYVEEARRWVADKESTESSVQAPPTFVSSTELTASTQHSVPSTQHSSLSSQSPKPRILLADDNADMRDYVKRLLKEHYEVEAVVNGAAALAAARQRQPDLVLSDVMMPGMDGFELLRKLRENPRTATVPVILLSARAGEESRVEGLDEGADDYLIKPFSARELLARVHTHLTLRRDRQEIEGRKRELERALATQAATARRRVGLELHDGVRQQLAAIRWLADNLQKQLAAKGMPQAEMLEQFTNLVAEANHEVRRLINGLAPPEVGAADLRNALEQLANDTDYWYGIVCRLDYGSEVKVNDEELAGHLYHIAREAVTNAAKHGEASQTDLSLRNEDETLVLQIRDDGKGLPEDYDQTDGLGVESMRQRAELIGAKLTIESSGSSGTVVSCRLPL